MRLGTAGFGVGQPFMDRRDEARSLRQLVERLGREENTRRLAVLGDDHRRARLVAEAAAWALNSLTGTKSSEIRIDRMVRSRTEFRQDSVRRQRSVTSE